MKIKVVNDREKTEKILTLTDERHKKYIREFVKIGDCKHDCEDDCCPLRGKFNNGESYCMSYSNRTHGHIEILEGKKQKITKKTMYKDLCDGVYLMEAATYFHIMIKQGNEYFKNCSMMGIDIVEYADSTLFDDSRTVANPFEAMKVTYLGEL